jgi:23S rRNA (cytosine1962-C5)-methyltransferase
MNLPTETNNTPHSTTTESIDLPQLCDLPKIELLPGYHQRFLSGVPWIYTNELKISNQTKSLSPGTVVTLTYHDKPIATGYYNRHSLIAFRVLNRNPFEIINETFFQQRLKAAAQLRQRFFSKPYYRLIHAEGDELPGLIIDRFKDVFVVQLNTQGMERLLPFLIAALKSQFNAKTIYIKRDSKIREQEGLPLKEPEIIGEPVTEITVIENNAHYRVDLSQGQKTGWFFDHRMNRKLVASFAKNKSVIDYFCYNGGFSIQAALEGAKSVIGVDRSSIAITNATRSAAENAIKCPIEFVCQEVFDDIDERIKNQETFDIVILDPPAFVKVKKDLAQGLRGYEKLITRGLKLVAPEGLLLIASCSYHVKMEDLKLCLAHALNKAERIGKILQYLHAGFDHPCHPMLAESEYLKGFLVAVD